MSKKDVYGEDPKTTLMRLLLNNVKVTKDNDKKATIRVTQGDFNGELFKNCDAQITVNLVAPSPAETLNVGGTWKKYQDRYAITGYAIDKKGITAKKMRWKLRKQIEDVIEANRKNPGDQLTRVSVVSVGEGKNMASKPPYFSVIVTVSTLRYET